jgi:hypothetical protein
LYKAQPDHGTRSNLGLPSGYRHTVVGMGILKNCLSVNPPQHQAMLISRIANPLSP